MSCAPLPGSLATSTAIRRLPFATVCCTRAAPKALLPVDVALRTAPPTVLACACPFAALIEVWVRAVVCVWALFVEPEGLGLSSPPIRTIARTIASTAAPPIRIAPPRRDGRGPSGAPVGADGPPVAGGLGGATRGAEGAAGGAAGAAGGATGAAGAAVIAAV